MFWCNQLFIKILVYSFASFLQDPVDLGWRPYVKTWLHHLPRDIPESGRTHLQALFDHSLDQGLIFVRQYSKQQTIPVPEMSLVMCLCNILTAFIDFMAKHGGFGASGAIIVHKTKLLC